MKFKSSIVAILALSGMALAGGDIGGVTTFENEDYVAAEVAAEVTAVEPAPVAAPTPAPKAVEPTPTPVASAGNFYVGAGIAALASRCDCDGSTANPFAEEDNQDRQVGVTGVVGYDFMDYLGAELRASMGVSEDKEGSEMIQAYGVYLKPNIDLTDALNLYGLVGYGISNMTNSQDLEEMNGGLSYGAGLDYGITENISIFTDVLNFVDDQDASNIGANLGLKYNF